MSWVLDMFLTLYGYKQCFVFSEVYNIAFCASYILFIINMACENFKKEVLM